MKRKNKKKGKNALEKEKHGNPGGPIMFINEVVRTPSQNDAISTFILHDNAEKKNLE